MKSAKRRLKPRNSLVAVARFLHAGAHRKQRKALRRADRIETHRQAREPQ